MDLSDWLPKCLLLRWFHKEEARKFRIHKLGLLSTNLLGDWTQMPYFDFTTIRTVTIHLKSMYVERGVEDTAAELDVFLNHIEILLRHDQDHASECLMGITLRLFQSLGVNENVCSAQLIELFDRFKEVCTTSGKCQEFRKFLVHFLLHWERNKPENAVNGHGIEKMKEFVSECPLEILSMISVGYLADRFQLSRSHLSRRFKEIYGRSISEFLTSERMNRAFGLLTQPSSRRTVQEIGRLVGFTDVAYFRSKFKNWFGCTPGHLLSSAISDEGPDDRS